jgi:hypothetical protein
MKTDLLSILDKFKHFDEKLDARPLFAVARGKYSMVVATN